MPDLQDQVQVETGLIPPSLSAAVTRYSTYCFQIHRIISDIKLSFYHLPCGGDDSDSFLWLKDPEAHQMRIEEALSSWWETVSQDALSYPCLDDKQRRIWKAKLKVTYHKTMTLLHQPSQAIRSPSVQSLLKCFDNASVVLHEYQNLNDLRGFQHGWRAVHNIFAAGATIIYSFWTSEIVRQNASMESLSKSLRICSSLLALGGEWWPSVKNGLANFGTVADLTVRKLYTDGAPNKTPRLSMRHDVTLLSRLQEESAGFGPPDDIPAQALTGALQATGTHPDQHQLTEADGASMEGPWISLYPDTEPQMTDGGCAPEIGSFLANFDNADFTWSFTLDCLDNQDGMRGFSSFNI